MRRESICRTSGSASLICVLVLFVILFFGAVTLELGVFFGLREQLRSELDSIARRAIRDRLSPGEIEGVVRGRLHSDDSRLLLGTVQPNWTEHGVDLQAAFEYRPVLAELFPSPARRRASLRFALRSRVERLSLEVFVILDRSIPVVDDSCGSVGLIGIARYADQLSEAFVKYGGATVARGISPGVHGAAVAWMDEAGSASAIDTCSAGEVGTLSFSAIAGERTSESGLPQFGWDTAQSILGRIAGHAPLRRRVVLITQSALMAGERSIELNAALQRFVVSSESLRMTVIHLGGTSSYGRDGLTVIPIRTAERLGAPLITGVVAESDARVLAE